jgi:hypothetical protein
LSREFLGLSPNMAMNHKNVFFLAGKFQNMRLVYGRALEIAKELMDQGALPIRNRSVLDDNLLPTKVSTSPGNICAKGWSVKANGR